MRGRKQSLELARTSVGVHMVRPLNIEPGPGLHRTGVDALNGLQKCKGNGFFRNRMRREEVFGRVRKTLVFFMGVTLHVSTSPEKLEEGSLETLPLVMDELVEFEK